MDDLAEPGMVGVLAQQDVTAPVNLVFDPPVGRMWVVKVGGGADQAGDAVDDLLLNRWPSGRTRHGGSRKTVAAPGKSTLVARATQMVRVNR
jgi:hypothetical protein